MSGRRNIDAGPPCRGEVWLVDFGTPVGHEQGFRRPAIVLSEDVLAVTVGLVVVVPVTRTRSGLASHVEVEPGASGLRNTSYAKAEDVKSVSVERLDRRLGDADPLVMRRLSQIVAWLLSVP